MRSERLLTRRAERLSRRPKTLRFTVLAVLWVFPSIGAVWILALNWKVWSTAPTVLDALRTTRVEQWIALGLLALHALFVFGALRHWKDRPQKS